MNRVLLTGMSGTGKSSVIKELRNRGFNAIDMDEPGWSIHDPEGNQFWCESQLQAAINSAGEATLFISGCAENQVIFYPQFTHIILLSIPVRVLIQRLQTRANNPYGKLQEQLEQVLTDLENVEPLLRRAATCEIRTIVPLDQVVEVVLAHVFMADQ